MKRMVDTDIWVDRRVEELGSHAKLLWLYILTAPQGNLAGCFELTMRRIEVDTGMKAAQAKKVLGELSAAGLICCSADTCEVLIIRWWKYNWSGGSPKLEKPLGTAIQSVKNGAFRAYLAELFYEAFGKPLAGYEETAGKYPIDTLLEQCRYPSISIPITNPKPITSGNGNGNQVVGVGKPAQRKRPFGEFGNVMLTESELESLRQRFPSDWGRRIDDLSFYIGSKGDKYKSHYRTILNWARDEKSRKGVTIDEELASYGI